jgi:hypothetical protein
LTVRLRAAQAGRLGLAWRCGGQRDFSPEQVATVEFPAGAGWQEVRLEAPASGKVIHMRVQFPTGAPLDLAKIELRGGGSQAVLQWVFDRAPAVPRS